MTDTCSSTKLFIALCTGVKFLPSAEAAIFVMALHDDEEENIPRWRRRARYKLILDHNEVLPENASAAMLVEAFLRHEIVSGAWFN